MSSLIKDYMWNRPPFCYRSSSLWELANAFMLNIDLEVIPVIKDGKSFAFLGFIRKDDLLAASARRFPFDVATADEFLGNNSKTFRVYEDNTVDEALEKMKSYRFGTLAVLERDESLIGTISYIDLIEYAKKENRPAMIEEVANLIISMRQSMARAHI